MTAMKCILLFFQFTCLDEKNEKRKETVRKKFTEYLDRAEKIKEMLQNKESRKAKVGAVGKSPILSLTAKVRNQEMIKIPIRKRTILKRNEAQCSMG
jgi:hypothetical protein